VPLMRRTQVGDRVVPLALLSLGLAVGTAVGVLGWSAVLRRHRRALFHADKLRRLAALGYLRAHPSVDSARLLRDYLQWEPHPLLRRRARGVLRRTELALRS
jgi:hypothetical protein